ncbi:5'-3'-deoxyribonucleotidase [Pullulanibacillus sp. KACC 23026]|uniref:5' nucleotidase, NT5C type n=1 Tax=Pullulanibacillus sp. KACC 23026 TaxID=3028315 RepID=UPI0023B03BB0|nr:5'-3'-deoxyribonucleotidase [Pullulanibacillus sp. KACC 23026]WEG14554.1 5'-3'-deoxyribonucleotidase [Pullulanibacillus sp. KACC 23026]
MKRIAIDMDEVIADFVPKHLELFNEKHNEALTLDDLRGKKLAHLRPHLNDEIRRLYDNHGFFRSLNVIKDSQEVIKELSEHYEIYIATAAMEVPSSFAAKYEWLKEHFSFLNEMNFVFCGDKSIIHADYLIDDNVRNFKGFIGQGILFSSPHNLFETGYVRVNNWQEVREYFLGDQPKA